MRLQSIINQQQRCLTSVFVLLFFSSIALLGGNITLITQTQVDNFNLNGTLTGNLSIGNAFSNSNIQNLNGLSGLRRIDGDLVLSLIHI